MKTETESTKHYKMLVRRLDMLTKHGNASLRGLRQVRGSAYDAAAEYIWLADNDPKGLDQMIRKESKTTTLKWLDERFRPLVVLTGDNYHQLIQSIRKGMTREQYMDTTPEKFLHNVRQQVKVVAKKVNDLASAVGGETTEARSENWRDRAIKAERALKAMTKDRDRWRNKFETLKVLGKGGGKGFKKAA